MGRTAGWYRTNAPDRWTNIAASTRLRKPELGEDVAEMTLDRLDAHIERSRDLTVGESLCAQHERLALPFGEPIVFAGPVEMVVRRMDRFPDGFELFAGGDPNERIRDVVTGECLRDESRCTRRSALRR